jgi:acyl carrier protein
VSSNAKLVQAKVDEILEYISLRIHQNTSIGESVDVASLKIDDTGIDSLELTEMIMELEDRFSVMIDDTKLSGSTTISELAAQVAGQMK